MAAIPDPGRVLSLSKDAGRRRVGEEDFPTGPFGPDQATAGELAHLTPVDCNEHDVHDVDDLIAVEVVVGDVIRIAQARAPPLGDELDVNHIDHAVVVHIPRHVAALEDTGKRHACLPGQDEGRVLWRCPGQGMGRGGNRRAGIAPGLEQDDEDEEDG